MKEEACESVITHQPLCQLSYAGATSVNIRSRKKSGPTWLKDARPRVAHWAFFARDRRQTG